MKETFQELVKRTSIVFIIIGVFLFLLGIVSEIVMGTFSLKIDNTVGKAAVIIVGLLFIGLGIFLVWRESAQTQEEGIVEVKSFSDSEELYRYVSKRIEQAKKQIDDTTWGPLTAELTTSIDKEAFEDYLEAMISVCKKGTVVYREVMGFHPNKNMKDRIGRAERMLKLNLFSYHLRIYEYPVDKVPPLLSFMIIDSEEVILAFYRSPYMPIEGEIRLSVKNPKIVRMFQDYYNTIWHGAKRIKQGNSIEWTEYDDLKKRLTQ